MDEELKQHLEAMEGRINAHINARLDELEMNVDGRFGRAKLRVEDVDARFEAINHHLETAGANMKSRV